MQITIEISEEDYNIISNLTTKELRAMPIYIAELLCNIKDKADKENANECR